MAGLNPHDPEMEGNHLNHQATEPLQFVLLPAIPAGDTFLPAFDMLCNAPYVFNVEFCCCLHSFSPFFAAVVYFIFNNLFNILTGWKFFLAETVGHTIFKNVVL